MLGSALYFPRIDIDDPAWLRSAILFWDEIQTIAPSAIEEPYQNEDSKICHAEGYLKPLRCDLHPQLIEDLGRKVLSLVDRGGINRENLSRSRNSISKIFEESSNITYEVEEAFNEVGVHLEKLSPELRQFVFQYGVPRMQPGKVSPWLRRRFQNIEMTQMHPDKFPQIMHNFFKIGSYLTKRQAEWVLVDSRFADAYMSALAAKLSNEFSMSPLTSSEKAQGLSLRFLFDDVADSFPEQAEGAMIGVIMRGLKVDTSVPVAKLIKFRKSRKDQYLDFSNKILELSDEIKDAADPDGGDIFDKAQKLYNKNIDPSLRALKRELDQQSISSVWEGAYRAITISAPSAGALAYFTGLGGPALLGAGAALVATDISVRRYLSGRQARASNPFSYLHDINANFGLPNFEE